MYNICVYALCVVKGPYLWTSLSLSFSSLPPSLLSLPPPPPSLLLQNLLNENGATYVFNHVHLIISYHKGSEQNKYQDGRIVRAQIQLASCKETPCSPQSKPLSLPKKDELGDKFDITYSYTVEFIVSQFLRLLTLVVHAHEGFTLCVCLELHVAAFISCSLHHC